MQPQVGLRLAAQLAAWLVTCTWMFGFPGFVIGLIAANWYNARRRPTGWRVIPGNAEGTQVVGPSRGQWRVVGGGGRAAWRGVIHGRSFPILAEHRAVLAGWQGEISDGVIRMRDFARAADLDSGPMIARAEAVDAAMAASVGRPMSALLDDPEPAVVLAVWRFLHREGGDGVFSAMLDPLADTHPPDPMTEAERAYARSRACEAALSLVRSAGGTGVDGPGLAVEALDWLAAHAPEAVPHDAVERLVSHVDPQLSAAAIGWLGARGDVSVVPALLAEGSRASRRAIASIQQRIGADRAGELAIAAAAGELSLAEPPRPPRATDARPVG